MANNEKRRETCIMQTIDFDKLSLRTLKMIRQYHRKLRAHPLHNEALQSVNKSIKKKQKAFSDENTIKPQTKLSKFIEKVSA